MLLNEWYAQNSWSKHPAPAMPDESKQVPIPGGRNTKYWFVSPRGKPFAATTLLTSFEICRSVRQTEKLVAIPA